jgi:hypothetical protein
VKAAHLVAQAEAAGVRVQLNPDGRIRMVAAQAPPADLLAVLRARKAEIIELLRGERCRHCGERIDWTRPGAVIFADGRAAHLACYERIETERQATQHERRQPTEQAA